jgi:hypothetical protein
VFVVAVNNKVCVTSAEFMFMFREELELLRISWICRRVACGAKAITRLKGPQIAIWIHVTA